MKRTIASIIEAARSQIRMIKNDREILTSTSDVVVRQKAFANIVTVGRSVTITLQGLKTPLGEMTFNKWYEPYFEQMKSSTLMRAFVDARNNWLKKGQLDTHGELGAGGFNTAELYSNLPSKPEFATGFFIGDEFGASGWILEIPDGTKDKYYVDIKNVDPLFKVSAHLYPEELTHLGNQVLDTSIENCSKLYLDYLDDVLKSAERNFLK